MTLPKDHVVKHSKPWITLSDRRVVDCVLASGMVAQGELVKVFEEKIAHYLGSVNGIAVASGTAALILGLKALDINSDDEVILPTYVCQSVLKAVISTGAKPVLCDIGDEWNMTAETVAAKITSQTAAIIVVHIFGIPTDTYRFEQFGIPIIEDCCQAFGAELKGKKVGTIGTMGIFSFNATKCLTTGEGGMVLSDDMNLLEKMRTIRDGKDLTKGEQIASPMTDLQAALGINQLNRYHNFLQRRKEIANRYFRELKNCLIELPESLKDKSIFFRFPIRIPGEFDIYKQSFQQLNVQIRHGVDNLLHKNIKLQYFQFPIAEKTFRETVSIPIYPALQDEEVNIIIAACLKNWSI